MEYGNMANLSEIWYAITDLFVKEDTHDTRIVHDYYLCIEYGFQSYI